MRRCTSFLLPVLLSLAPAATLAQTTDPYLATHHSVILGNLCLGVTCGNLVTDDDDDLTLSANVVSLLFRDASDEPNFPTNDWRLVANDPGTAPFGPDYFGIQDVDGDTLPFRVKAGAPNHALVISPEGHIGLGTLSPETDVHIVSGDTPSILLAQDGSQGFPAQNWIVGGHNDAFILRDVTAGTWPVSVGTGAATHSLVLTTNNRTGLGIFEPEAAVHLFRDNGEAKILVQEINDNPAPRTLLELKNNGRPEIVLANTDTGGEWSFGAGTRFILKHGAVGSTSNAKAKLFEVTDAGDAILAGSLTTGGTTCGTGCDAVFEPDYPLPSIADHAAQMQALGYLPNVGPTPEGAPFDLTDKLGRMLNELEHAHLYIAQLETRNAEQAATLATVLARLDALETARPASD